MAYSVKLLPVVRKDLETAKRWYNLKKNNLGDEFREEVKKEIDFPKHYQVKYKDLHQSVVQRFPYSIFYMIEESRKRVVIFGILHTSRNSEIILDQRK